LEPVVKAKMLAFVLPTEKHLVVSFSTFFQISWQPGELKRTETAKHFVDAGVSF